MRKQSHILFITESKMRLVLGTVPLVLKTLNFLSVNETSRLCSQSNFLLLIYLLFYYAFNRW
jgi:hypothetical protein